MIEATVRRNPETVCRDCPRHCGIDRSEGRPGFCGMPANLYISRCAPHFWEEPPISGVRGSGTVFFTGCNLRCVFCQNRTVSRDRQGHPVTDDELIDLMLDLQEREVHNINLVTPTHYTTRLCRVLERVKPQLHIPVVWNSGGYESVEALRRLEGLVDIYLPDFKYISPELSTAYSAAPDYAVVAAEAVTEMHRQVGAVSFDGEGMLRRGLVIRHLVLPGHRADSIAVLRRIAELLDPAAIRVSVMRQYTPDFAMDCPYKNLHRRVTDFEYQSVLREAADRGLQGYSQGKDAADRTFTPDFEGEMPISGLK